MRILLILALILLLAVQQTHSTCSVTDCAVCQNSGTVCASCNPGYTMGGSGTTCTINPCAGNCKLCPNLDSCFTCDFGYAVNQTAAPNNCVKINCTDTNCSLCSSTASSACYSCLPESYVKNNLCELCTTTIPHCTYCFEDVSTVKCTACATTYYADT